MIARNLGSLLGAILLFTSVKAAGADGPVFKYDPSNPESRMAMAECEHKLPDKATNAQRMACFQKEMRYRAEKMMYDAKQSERALQSEIDRETGEIEYLQQTTPAHR